MKVKPSHKTAVHITAYAKNRKLKSSSITVYETTPEKVINEFRKMAEQGPAAKTQPEATSA